MHLWKFIRENVPVHSEIVDESGAVKSCRDIRQKKYSKHLQAIRQILRKNIVLIAPFYSNFFPDNQK